jgi:hypothetical protein
MAPVLVREPYMLCLESVPGVVYLLFESDKVMNMSDVGESDIIRLPSRVTDKSGVIPYMEGVLGHHRIVESRFPSTSRRNNEKYDTHLGCFFIYDKPSIRSGTTPEEALSISEMYPGTEFTISYELEKGLLDLDDHEYANLNSNLQAVRMSWLVKQSPYSVQGYGFLLYDPKRVRALQKRRKKRRMQEIEHARSGKPVFRKKPYLTCNDYITVIQELWRGFCFTDELYDSVAFSDTSHMSKAQFNRRDQEWLMGYISNLEKSLKALLGEVPVNKALFGICESLHQCFFVHHKKLKNKPDRQLKLFVNRVRKAGVSKGRFKKHGKGEG